MTRLLAAADLPACVDLFVTTFAAPPWEETWRPDDALRRLTDMLATPRSCGVVVPGPDGTVLGFALGHRQRFGDADHFLLQEMCVDAGRRREGLGSALLEALASELADVEHWYLLTARESPAAAFYGRHGFREAARMGVFARP